jgi:4'-phosphopantetheinyl transferase
MVEVFATHILPDNQFLVARDTFLSFIPSETQEKIMAFIRPSDAQRSLFGELMIRRLLCERLGIKNQELRIRYGEKGKPFVPDSPVHFNLSHSGDWVVAAVSEQPVGIDVERIKPNKLAIARRFFTETEVRSIMDLPEEQRLDQFYSLWTLKESYLKAVGKGLTLSLGSFSVKRDINRYRIEINGTFAGINLKLLPLDDRYKLAVCAYENITTDEVSVLPASGYLECMKFF